MFSFACLPVALLLAPTALAEPSYARLYKAEFGYMPSCFACHANGGGSELNGYGLQFKEYKMDRAAFSAIASLDADGDGFANGIETLKKSNPGDAESYPGNLGEWLDVNALIPIQIRELYPEVKTYKPIDTLLTDKEIARAAAMDVTLTPADENIIYLPLVDKRPLGTVIIVPAEHEDQRFYLLVATDKKLTITHVQPLDADQAPPDTTAESFASLVGLTAEAIQMTDTDNTANNAIRLATKRGATLIHVRLKKK